MRQRKLTERQLQILRLIGEGHQFKSIAKQLGCSPNTVRTHVKFMYERLDVHTTASAVMEAGRLGYFDELKVQKAPFLKVT